MTLHQIADTALIASQLFTLISLRLAIKRGNEWRDDWTQACSDHLVDRIKLLHWEQNAVLHDLKPGNLAKKNEHGETQ